ncbi:hypothetical protein ACQQ2N_16775 [Dokdonella sp. MW10]|uniref:hypothetical protein n=1 Tax=Dokdonella sp. MW10 TaxID=2992926 RepID=UPI003F7E0522
MSTAPISSSSGYGFPAGLPEDLPEAATQGQTTDGGDGGDAGDPLAEGPRGGGFKNGGGGGGLLGDFRDSAQSGLGLVAGGQSGRFGEITTPNAASQPNPPWQNPGNPNASPFPGQAGGANGQPAGGANGGQQNQGGPTNGANTPATGNGQNTGGANGGNPGTPGTGQTIGGNNGNAGMNPGANAGTPSTTTGMQGNGIIGGTLNAVGGTVSSLTGGLLGSGGVLAAPLSILSGGSFGGMGSVLSAAGSIPLAVGQAVGNTVAYVAGQAQGNGNAQGNPHAANPNAPSQTQNPASNAPPQQHANPNAPTAQAAGSTTHPNAPRPTTTSQAGSATSANANSMPAPPTQAASPRPATPGSVAEPAHPSAAASVTRGSVTDLPHVAAARQGVPTLDTHAATNTTNTSNAHAAARQGGLNAVQPLANPNNVLTLMLAPHAQIGAEDGSITHTALFRGQTADGQEAVRDILGRSYVFSADGKLVTRAQERMGIEAIEESRTDAIDADSAANHGELSTHDILWKVVAPAFVGMGALLGGATAGAGIAAGSTGMGGTFLLVAAASILGYGAVRAISNLREMSDEGASIRPLDNPAARTHWVAAGSQSVGSLASLALLLI